MSEETKSATPAKPQASAENKPAYLVYQVISRQEGQTPIWKPIGAAWAHKDGRGLGVRLDALPLTGSIELREPKPEEV